MIVRISSTTLAWFLRDCLPGRGTENAGGTVVARDTILNRLREIVDAEDKSNPLSDEEIMKRFNQEGFDLKHRTITKYRTMLDIPTSRKRRQF